MPETLVSAAGFHLRAGISVGSSQSSNPNLGCSKPLIVGDVVHVVVNEQLSSGNVRNHFVSARFADVGLGVSASSGGTGRIRSWCSSGRRPIRVIQALDDDCSTLVYAQDELFHFATAGGSSGGDDGRGGVGGGGNGYVSESLPVHTGSVADFRVNPFSRDIVSGGNDGHVHVLNFPPDMAGVPTMKVSKYVGSPVTCVRWGQGQPYVASWTTPAGFLQMLDARDYRLVCGLRVDDPLGVLTHEYISDVVMAVGCASGSVQLFDVRNMSAFLKLHDPVAGGIQQILPFASEPSPHSSGVGDWVTFGTEGVSWYGMNVPSNGNIPGAAPGGSMDGDVMSRLATGLCYKAGCRSADLNLTADLDINAGLFLAPSHASRMGYHYGKQLCGFTLDARIVTFGPDVSGSSKLGAASQGGSSAAPNDGMRMSHG